jgi:DHA1 family multidrug resistance protein-like MFS transporter
VLADPAVRRVFLIFGVSYLATQMSRPYIPLVVEQLAGSGPGLVSSIALVAGTAALVGGIVSPLGGVLGDRIGFRPVLVAALGGAGVVLLIMPIAPSVGVLAVLAVVLGAATATVTAMVFGLLATEVPPERRSATLNLVYLPLYAAGIVGPALGAGVATAGGLAGPFVLGGGVFLLGSLGVLLGRRSAGDRSAGDEAVAIGVGFRPEG